MPWFFPLRNVVLVKCRCSKCRCSKWRCSKCRCSKRRCSKWWYSKCRCSKRRCSGHNSLKQERLPNEKGAINTVERSIKSCSSHHCQALSRCSVQMITQNICAISSTCCKPQNVTLQTLCKDKSFQTAVHYREKWESKGKGRSKQLLKVTPYVLHALMLTFPNAKPWHCANNQHFLYPGAHGSPKLSLIPPVSH